MNHFLINGVEKDLPQTENKSLRELIDEIRKGYSNESTLISSILVNGVEIDAHDEQMIGNVSLSELRSLEVFTAHPKEIAEETLQSLVEFTKHLEEMCTLVSEDHSKLPKLADGITTFIDALANVKQILRIGIMPSIQVLEADLVSILRDMLEFQQKKQIDYVAMTVRDALSSNLALWRTEGLPFLIRSRDS
jgi:hypothetical protein